MSDRPKRHRFSTWVVTRCLPLAVTVVMLGTAEIASAQQAGDTGAAVANLQTQLRDAGYYSGPIDGEFGPATEDAVIRFQQASGLTADGVAGPGTQSALSSTRRSASENQGTGLALGTVGPEVSDLQFQLRDAGYYNGPIDGEFGPATEDAVIRFQQAGGLTVDGVVGPTTQAALRRSLAQTAAQAFDSPASAASDTTILSLGDRGTVIQDLQTRLRELGYYNGPIDGVFGSSTEIAVADFQRSQGLTVDGVVGPATVSALQRPAAVASGQTPVQRFGTAPTPVISPLVLGSRGSTVQDLQTRLRQLGYYNGPIDGVFGSSTEAAVIAFQQTQDIFPDGIVGADTVLALQNPRSLPLPSFPSGSVTQTPTPRFGSSTAISTQQFSVADLQRRLRDQGFYSGPIDGAIGPGTRAAIAAAQRRYSVSENDIIGGRF